MLEIPEPHRVAAVALDNRPCQGFVRNHHRAVGRIVGDQRFGHRLAFTLNFRKQGVSCSPLRPTGDWEDG